MSRRFWGTGRYLDALLARPRPMDMEKVPTDFCPEGKWGGSPQLPKAGHPSHGELQQETPEQLSSRATGDAALSPGGGTS